MSNKFGQIVPEYRLFWQIRELTAKASQLIGSKNAISFDQIAAIYNLKVNITTFHKDGALINNTIIINSNIRSKKRQNFTFFHELTHHLIESDDEMLSAIHQGIREPDEIIERLCDAGAAELLMPRSKVEEFVQLRGFTANNIRYLSEEFSASEIAVAIHMTVSAYHDCYLVIAEPIAINENEHLKDLLIRYTSKSSSSKYSIARNTYIPKRHLMHQVFNPPYMVSGLAPIPFKSGNRFDAHCDAILLDEHVYAFFNVSQPQSPSQLRLF